jgi:hypothetical protein
MDMRFLDQHAGAFTRRRTVDGIPASASSGTFRDEYVALLAQSVPASVSNTLITFSGSGRPLGLEVHPNGAATLPGPAGTKTFVSSYTVTGAAQARLGLIGNGGITETWTLEFTGPACGTYTGIAARNGTLRRTSRGSFTIASR